MEKNRKPERNVKPAEDQKREVSQASNREFETMSQQQNRYGKGRERNGSDGGRSAERMNH